MAHESTIIRELGNHPEIQVVIPLKPSGLRGHAASDAGIQGTITPWLQSVGACERLLLKDSRFGRQEQEMRCLGHSGEARVFVGWIQI